MSLTQEQIIHIAKLAKLHLSEADIERYQKDLNSIVDYIDILNSVPESELQKVRWNIRVWLVARRDEEGSFVTREELLACSPKKIVNHQISIDNIMN